MNRRLPSAKGKIATELMKNELGGKIMKEFYGLKAKTYNPSIVDKNMCHKKNLKFEDYKNFLGLTQLENKMNHLENDETQIESLKKDHKESIKTRD